MLEKVYEQLRRIFNKDNCFEEFEDSGFYSNFELKITDEELERMRRKFDEVSKDY